MKIAVISFTYTGSRLACDLTGKLRNLGYECRGYVPLRFQDKLGVQKDGICYHNRTVHEWTKDRFEQEDGLIYIGALGIAVRAISPCIKDKYKDPAVIVLDEMGKHAISLLSGHVGGANRLTERVAEVTGAKPVITTASDVQGMTAVDVWAKEHGLEIGDREVAKRLAVHMLEGGKATVSVDSELDFWRRERICDELPGGCVWHADERMPEEYQIRITVRDHSDPHVLCLYPKVCILGIGCRKGIQKDQIRSVVTAKLQEAGISLRAVKAIASIDLKKQEEGLCSFAEECGIPFVTYSAGTLGRIPGDFEESSFVQTIAGVGNVCERAAAAEAGHADALILRKQVSEGVTVAAAISQGRPAVMIFGGTTEGRKLAEWSVGQGLRTMVSVATEYGSQVLSEHPLLQVLEGRLDQAQMECLLADTKPRLVLDATHPHASEVTRTIRQACAVSNFRYVRVLRDPAAVVESKNERIFAANAKEAVDYLKQTEGVVFLTTGSKELPVFAGEPELRKRLVVRVLPMETVLRQCSELGLSGKQLIAMQGPFSAEMNTAMLKAADARWLVTKESGAGSGYAEKLEAADAYGVKTIVIGRPTRETGISLQQAQALLRKEFHIGRQISLIGLGMGRGSQLTKESLDALEAADTVFGAVRMLEDVKPYTGNAVAVPFYKGEDICRYVEEHEESSRIAVVFSGDTGYHSGAKGLLSSLKEKFGAELEAGDMQVAVYPGISTLSALCARFQMDWTDLCPASMHGAECDIVKLLKEYGKVFLLLGGKRKLKEVCQKLTDLGLGNSVLVHAGVRLGYEDERLIEDLAENLTGIQNEDLAAVILENVIPGDYHRNRERGNRA